VHCDLIDPTGSVAKLDAYRRSDFYGKTRAKYAPGWEANARVGDAKFARFDANEWAVNDYRPHEGRDRILGERLVGSAVGDLLRRLSLAGRAQLFPRMVALDTMSAKL